MMSYDMTTWSCLCYLLLGVGGVHRGGENSMDISADLIELGKTPMAGVLSMIVALLDIC